MQICWEDIRKINSVLEVWELEGVTVTTEKDKIIMEFYEDEARDCYHAFIELKNYFSETKYIIEWDEKYNGLILNIKWIIKEKK